MAARRLNQPTEHERKHEREGNAYINDSLTDREVEQTLSRNSDRIEYMMFVGTRKTVPNNTYNINAQNAPVIRLRN